MTDEQINELLAEKVKGWKAWDITDNNVWIWVNNKRDFTGYFLANGRNKPNEIAWSPITNLNQAWDCLYVAQHTKVLDVDISINPIPTKDSLARTICLALVEAIGGEG